MNVRLTDPSLSLTEYSGYTTRLAFRFGHGCASVTVHHHHMEIQNHRGFRACREIELSHTRLKANALPQPYHAYPIESTNHCVCTVLSSSWWCRVILVVV